MTKIIEERIKILNSVLPKKKDQDAVEKAFLESEGDWTIASTNLKDNLSEEIFHKVSFAHSLADWSNDNLGIVKRLAEQPDLKNIRDVALRYSPDKLAVIVSQKDVPETTVGITDDEKKRNLAIALHRTLFDIEPSAVLQRMVDEGEIPIADPSVSKGVARVLSNLPDFNIRATSVYTAFKQPEAFNDIPEEQRSGVMQELKHLSLMTAISPIPEAIPVLKRANLPSAFIVAQMPEKAVMERLSPKLGEEITNLVYKNAIDVNIRNMSALMTIRETIRGSRLAAIDGKQSIMERLIALQAVANKNEVPLNLETLFGNIDFCECEDCLSVYSPASYFVDLLQYLRNNDLDPNNLDPSKVRSDPKDIKGTPLEKLFRRRPDLGCLELTCENTFTVLPYVDLVNEVMESFVVHLDKYQIDANVPKQSTLEAFNVKDETTGELLAQPQHVNYQAYCILKNAVYPFTLPYHQPIDVIRIWLKYMGISRYELLDAFRTATETCANVVLTAEQQEQLRKLHAKVLDRAVDAEFLGITQEEYIILTQQAFWPKEYFDLILQKVHTDNEYRNEIGVRPVYEYYGYDKKDDMLSKDEISKIGLTFVKKQFLPRTGIQYVDLVNLLKMQFINPALPQGKALSIMESIRFSYRFLQTLVDTSSSDPKVRFSKLIDFLNTKQPFVPLIEAQLHPDPCREHDPRNCLQSTNFQNWVYCYFDRIGKLIVLESGEGPQLPIEGKLFEEVNNGLKLIGSLHKDGTITDLNENLIGNTNFTGQVVDQDGKPFANNFENSKLIIKDENDKPVGSIMEKGIIPFGGEEPLNWLPPRDTCDLEKVRLKHLDGSSLTFEEYDRIQRFIRLWRKLGWTIDETNLSLTGLSADTGQATAMPVDCNFIKFDAFHDKCIEEGTKDNGVCPEGKGDKNCPEIPKVLEDISPEFLHQLVAVRKLLDLTGLTLDKLLTFWGTVSTFGEKSLYSRLFLTHNLLGIDKIFEPDTNGNYLTKSPKISEHMPIIMAALNMKSTDVDAVIALRNLPDELTLDNVSALYRHNLLSKILHVRVADLAELFSLFGDPFIDAQKALDLLQAWGKMEDAGFTFRQLDYIIRNHDDPLRPVAPTKKTILQVTKTLYDNLNAIDNDHQDIPEDKKDDATADLIRAKAGLLFDQSVVEQIIGLLEGTTVYTSPAPANLAIKIPDDLEKKLKYSNQKDATPSSASIQVTGILTDTESTQAKDLSNNPGWVKALNCISKQALKFFNDVLSGIFPKKDEAIKKLLAGDINLQPDPQNPNATDANTAPTKRFYFLQNFLPFLRQRLAHRLIVNTMSGSAGLANDITDILLSDVLLVGASGQHAIDALEQIHHRPAVGSSGWKGYLIPPTDDEYTLIVKGDTQPALLKIDGVNLSFPHQQQDCMSNYWSTAPVKLKAGKLYLLEMSIQDFSQLQWKTSISPKAAIPSSALLPDYSTQGTEEVFVKLYKTALLVNGFNLNLEETNYLQSHPMDFDGFNFNSVTLQHWLRLQAYTTIRDKLPKTEESLLDLLSWASKPDDSSKLSERIAAVTLWKRGYIERLIAPEHFDLYPKDFRNEINLMKLQKALNVSDVVWTNSTIGTDSDKIGKDIDRLFSWANPVSKFWVCHHIAEDIRATLRARYNQEDWEQVVKPLNNQLRENQKQALISYLLVQKDLIDWGVVDADSLFEFFLIDVQMDPCMQTSRIKQAISSVQSFIQRCLLGLEDKYGVPVDVLDRDRWEKWMQKYRVWEANRKVFLYPENWIEPQLRDDKSPFYKELESELLQKDINTQTVEDALKNYVFKVDEVAKLKVVGLFLDKDEKKLHIFSRTLMAPYFFYYRYFDVNMLNWYPWEKIQVDIPNYDLEENGQITKNGTYLIPVVWNKRLLIFFPQFSPKTQAQKTDDTITVTQDNKGLHIPTKKPLKFWEIKMAWSEYRNSKWTQKQISSEAIYEPSPSTSLPDVSSYEFIPRIVTNPPQVVIDIYRDAPAIGAFQFTGSQLFKDKALVNTKSPTFNTDFHYTTDTLSQIHSLQAMGSADPFLYNTEPYFETSKTSVTDPNGGEMIMKIHNDGKELNFYHPFAHELLGTLTAGNLEDLFAYYLSNYYQPNNLFDIGDTYGADTKAKYHELKRSYSLYNWEVGFHAPMLLADSLLKSQQFDKSLQMCHYVFNPLAKNHSSSKGTDDKRFWQFPPFKEIDAKNVLENLFLSLKPNTPNDQITEWRDNPFQPHVIARSRPSAYMKWVVMKYIEILIAYGDYYFRQNTLETIPTAIQYYVMAAHIYGPRGQKIPKRGKIPPQTYKSLLDKWDAFSNAMVEMELAFPYSNQTSLPFGVSNGAVVGLANIFGFASSLYFCIPDNPKLKSLRDTIDERLCKIRHCEDIQGVFRNLPLFEPPIDPGLLVQAAAQGLSLSSVLNDLNSPMPNYRFYYLLQKALELCSELKALGNAFLSAKEKGDAEALSQLRAKHENSINNLVMEVKIRQLDEAQKSLEALQQSRKGPVSRMQYYLKLIGEDLGKVPDDNTDFGDLPNQIEQPVDESGLKLIAYEKEEMGKAADAAEGQVGIGRIESIASMLHAIPTIGVFATPIGVGGNSTIGGSNFGSAMQGIARWMQADNSKLSFEGTNAGRKGGFLRQLQDRVHQANTAGYEIKNIDKQILTQQIRINIAQKEITNQQKQIDNAQEVEEYLRNKYTNLELYSWMESSIRTFYYQAYTLAYDLAKKAEKVYHFERGLTTSNFIQFGYWDASHDGLLAGERLYIGLKQLETAYQEKRGYDYEITKPISLRQVNPLALLELKANGICEFALPEMLFDMDHPGHYMRRIKSVALTVPCIVGPYTSLNCTLRLLEHKFRINAIAKDKNDYLEKTDESDERFSTVNVPITSIAVSTGQNDSGVFELNFRDERYIPFEGAGAISKWRIELPTEFRQFDYDTISDVILHLRYTTVEGGDKLKAAATGSVQEYLKNVEELSKQEGLFAAFDLKHEFPDEWYKANNPKADATERLLKLNNLNERLPIFTKGRKVDATDIYLVSSVKIEASKLILTQGSDEYTFTDGALPIGTMKSFVINDIECSINSWQLKVQDVKTEFDKLWLIVRYKM